MCAGNVIKRVEFSTVVSLNQIVMGSNKLQFGKLILTSELASMCFYDCVYAFTDNDIYEVGCLQVVKTLLSCLDDPQLPHLQWQECMAVLATRLPKDMRAQVLSTTQCCPLHSKEYGSLSAYTAYPLGS